jgi:hypothetical protein
VLLHIQSLARRGAHDRRNRVRFRRLPVEAAALRRIIAGRSLRPRRPRDNDGRRHTASCGAAAHDRLNRVRFRWLPFEAARFAAQ